MDTLAKISLLEGIRSEAVDHLTRSRRGSAEEYNLTNLAILAGRMIAVLKGLRRIEEAAAIRVTRPPPAKFDVAC